MSRCSFNIDISSRYLKTASFLKHYKDKRLSKDYHTHMQVFILLVKRSYVKLNIIAFYKYLDLNPSFSIPFTLNKKHYSVFTLKHLSYLCVVIKR